VIDFFGHLAYILLVAGTWLVGRYWIGGWLIRATGSTMWLILGIIMGMSAIWFWSGVFLVTDLLGFYRWKMKQCEPPK
jgi:hypothetical protein